MISATVKLLWIQTSISLLRHHSHVTIIVFDTNPSEHPLTTSKSASSLIQLSFGMLYRRILSLLLLWISLNHRSKPTTSKQFSILYTCKYVTFFFFFLLLIDCKYMVCSHRCIVVTIDGTSYDVDVDVGEHFSFLYYYYHIVLFMLSIYTLLDRRNKR